MTITHFWRETSPGPRACAGFGKVKAAAFSCALLLSAPACDSGGNKRIVSVKPPQPPEPDADTATSLGEVPDGAVPAERCVVNAKYLAEHKSCGVDADCAQVTYQVSCCPDAVLSVAAVAADDLAEVQACIGNSVPCACTGLTRAEDGRVVSDIAQPIVHCVDQKCVSAVGPRECGSRATCGAQEICVTYQNVPGGIPPDPDSPDNKLLTFRCVPNPCQGALDCKCVQPICDARDDAERMCEIKHNADSDVTCSAVQD